MKTYEFTSRVPRKYIGQYRPRSDGYEKASGQAKFSDDITLKRQFADMVYMKILRSPYPHARIRNVDTGKAEALPGVRGILRYSDPEVAQIKMTSASWTDGTATQDQRRGWTHGVLDRKILGDTAHWLGDEVGVAIAADSVETAEEALKLVEVEWEVLPFLVNTEDALKPEAPLIHPEVNPNDNYMPYYEFAGPDTYVDRGDVVKGFAEADIISETESFYGNPQQCALDYWNCLVDWGRDEKITIWSDSYATDQTRMHFHDMLDVPLSQIRAISPYEGGSHGRGDSGEQSFFIVTALMAKKLRRPVRYRQSRKEHFHDTRTSMIGKVKIGAKNDGTITAIQIENTGNTGAYADLSVAAIKFVPREWSELSPGRIPNLRMTGKGIYTNIIPASIMRSIGNIQMNYFLGLAMDDLAEKLNMDPIELAIKNITCHNVPAPNPCVEDIIRAAAGEIGWERRHAPGRGEWFEGTKKRGMGFAVNNTWHTENHEYRRGPTQVTIKLNPDGTVILDAPTVETGPGSNTCAVHACAETLGVKPEDVQWISVQDTQTGLKDQVQTDSAVSYILSESIYHCALELRGKLLAALGRRLKRSPEELNIEEGRVFVKDSPEIGMTIKEYFDSIDIFTEDTLAPLTGYYARDLSMEDFGTAYQATFAEVEVDTETGEVKVLQIAIACDGGTVLYPPGAEAQLVGGQVQGLAEALYEEMIYDEATCTPLNFNFIDYHFPTMADFPDVEPILMEVYKGRGIYGASGMGEGTPCCTPRAISNAVYNAIGVRINETPITPIKILNALRKDGE
ncbi:MAG: molybdopterin-dependent oxidoreductase [Eubacteriales bacterium]|nr:molybdopterin-dependent oxidoreductase [Eubacteriales bacterium]